MYSIWDRFLEPSSYAGVGLIKIGVATFVAGDKVGGLFSILTGAAAFFKPEGK